MAQDSTRSFGIGGRAGVNLTRVRGEAFAGTGQKIDFQTGTGFTGGGLLAFETSPNLTLQPEVLFSRRTVEAELDADLTTVSEAEIRTDWIDVPLVAKLHGASAGGVRPFATAGVTISFLLHAEQTVINTRSVRRTQDLTDEFTRTDVGLSFGGGFDFFAAEGQLTIDARYTVGLRRLDETDDIKQGTFTITGGVIF
jgi:hypothetical protein